MSSDASVPADVRAKYRDVWGYCGDEFPESEPPHFPSQLYIREARRLVGERVFTQLAALDKTPLGNLSVGMGCYNFDSHCEERYACADPELCKLYDKPYLLRQIFLLILFRSDPQTCFVEQVCGGAVRLQPATPGRVPDAAVDPLPEEAAGHEPAGPRVQLGVSCGLRDRPHGAPVRECTSASVV